MGLGWGASSTWHRLDTVSWQSCGSPGPLLMNSPSKSVSREQQGQSGAQPLDITVGPPKAPTGSQRALLAPSREAP